MPAFVKLLRDHEPEVRTAAALKATGVAERMGAAAGGGGVDGGRGSQQVQELIMPCVTELCADGSQHVRAAVASVIMGLAPVLGKSATIEQLLPLVLQLLRDEYPEVRLNVISRLHAVNAVIGVELLAQSLLPAVIQLAEDRQWRVRLAIIEYVPLLARQVCARAVARTPLCEPRAPLAHGATLSLCSARARAARVPVSRAHSRRLARPRPPARPRHPRQLGVELFDAELSKLCTSWLTDCVHTIREVRARGAGGMARARARAWPVRGHRSRHAAERGCRAASASPARRWPWLRGRTHPCLRGRRGGAKRPVACAGACTPPPRSLSPRRHARAHPPARRARRRPLLPLSPQVAILNLRKLIDVFGAEWAQRALLPSVLEGRAQANYLKRMTALLTAKLLADALPVDVLCSTLCARARLPRPRLGTSARALRQGSARGVRG